MHKSLAVIFLIYAILFFSPIPTYPESQEIISYLNEMGIDYYNRGRYDDALTEFNSALLLDSSNKTAQQYIEKIELQKDLAQDATLQKIATKKDNLNNRQEPALKKQVLEPPKKEPVRIKAESTEPVEKEAGDLPEDFIDKAVNKVNEKIDPVKISGEIRMGLGVTSEGDFLWKDADGNLNERDWHILYGPDKENTYDKRIFDRLRVDVDKEAKDGFGFHANITVDPWSFTAKSDKMLVSSNFGDAAIVQMKYWSNTRSTINEIYQSLLLGDSFIFPQVKAKDGRIPAMVLPGTFPFHQFFIPEAELHSQFQPVRELWVDYKKENLNFRFFPIGYQDQALTTDDPLGFSNHHIYWEESPWLDKWVPGHINTGATPQDFYKGKWDDSLSFYTRDSDNLRLTALRGFAFEAKPTDRTTIFLTSATPKDLWQDYDTVDSNKTAARIKHYVTDDVSVGGTYTSRIGFNQGDIDAVNNLVASDVSVLLLDKLLAEAELAYSTNTQDKTTSYYKSKNRGWSYYFSLSAATSGINSVDENYFSLKPSQEQKNFAKARLYFARMDRGFESPLSTYRETRDDSYWARHLHFRKPFDFYYTGLVEPMGWADIEPFAIGDGIDSGRQVVGFRIDSSLWDRFDNTFTVRNVNENDGDYIETEVRDEAVFEITDKLTAKALGIYQDLPETTAGIDPFVINPDTGEYLENANILGGEDPNLTTGSLGLEYELTDKVTVNGIWEYTNDYTLAYDNFPRGLLNYLYMDTYTEYGKTYRKEAHGLYGQNLFPLPPYDFYNIFKAGIRFTPIEELEIYLDFTRNDFRSAGQIDDNINHIGFEVGYIPFKKLGFYLKYTYSQWNDLATMVAGGSDFYDGHHNVFAEIRYLPSKDSELVMQYGEGGYAAIGTVNFDPFGGALMTLDTQHIFRLFYKKKF